MGERPTQERVAAPIIPQEELQRVKELVEHIASEIQEGTCNRSKEKEERNCTTN